MMGIMMNNPQFREELDAAQAETRRTLVSKLFLTCSERTLCAV